jgi:hypothetical protein
MTHCPVCHARLIRSTTFIEGSAIYRCVSCNRFLVEGSDQWVDAGPGLRDTLALIAGNVKHDQSVHEQIMTSDISDRRWERMYVD